MIEFGERRFLKNESLIIIIIRRGIRRCLHPISLGLVPHWREPHCSAGLHGHRVLRHRQLISSRIRFIPTLALATVGSTQQLFAGPGWFEDTPGTGGRACRHL